jgi:hypothetical protein
VSERNRCRLRRPVRLHAHRGAPERHPVTLRHQTPQAACAHLTEVWRWKRRRGRLWPGRALTQDQCDWLCRCLAVRMR